MDSILRDKIFENKFYVYELIDPVDNKVFYIGKGNKYRCFVHEYKTKNGKIPHKNSHLFNKIKKILINNSIIYNIVFSSMDEEECYDREELLIRYYGIENLCNLEYSNRGLKHTEETRKKIQNANLGKKHSEETKNKLRLINTGKKLTEETKNKISNILKEQYLNGTRKKHVFEHDDNWRKSVEKLKGRKHNPESIQKMKEKHKGKFISEEQREKIRKALTKERIEITKNCENCDIEFKVIIVKDGANNNIRKCCCRSCSSILANKNSNKNKNVENENIEIQII